MTPSLVGGMSNESIIFKTTSCNGILSISGRTVDGNAISYKSFGYKRYTIPGLQRPVRPAR